MADSDHFDTRRNWARHAAQSGERKPGPQREAEDLWHNAHLPREVRGSFKHDVPSSSFEYGSLTQTLTDSRTVREIVNAYEHGGLFGVMQSQNSWISRHPLYELEVARDVAAMGLQFLGGFGPEDHYFDSASAESKMMAQTANFAFALKVFLATHESPFFSGFGVEGYRRAGSNPIAQFVGGYKATFHISGNILFVRLDNTSSFGSFLADRSWAYRLNHDRSHWFGSMANTRQIYIIALRVQ